MEILVTREIFAAAERELLAALARLASGELRAEESTELESRRDVLSAAREYPRIDIAPRDAYCPARLLPPLPPRPDRRSMREMNKRIGARTKR